MTLKVGDKIKLYVQGSDTTRERWQYGKIENVLSEGYYIAWESNDWEGKIKTFVGFQENVVKAQ